jgi:hypothetical protein
MIPKIAKKQNKNRDDEVITRGILKQEFSKFEKRFEKKLDAKFVTKEEFRHHEDTMANMFGLVMSELGNIRNDIKEIRTEFTSLNWIVNRHDESIDDLQIRVKAIEQS